MNTYTYTYNETHRVQFGNDSIGFKDTWNDWSLIPSDRPVFVLPTLKTNFVDIPGGNGSLDLTTVLTDYPTYENRTGSLDFIVIEDPKRTIKSWTERITDISTYLNKQPMTAILSDDPDYIYKGRFYTTNWDNGDQYSTLTIDYNIQPFKYQKTPFTHTVTGSGTETLNTSDIEVQEIVFDEFVVSGSDSYRCSIDGGMNWIRLRDGSNRIPAIRTYNGSGQIVFTGTGDVSIKYRGGKL